jgi:hypothetical protein
MINIPLPFIAMWGIMLAGVFTHVLAKIKIITDKTPENVSWKQVLVKFRNREWPSYGMSLIFTGILAFSFVFMKRFSNPNNEEISYWQRWIPLSVIFLYFIGVLNQWLFYLILGRIQSKGKIDMDILKDKKDEA